MLPQPEWIGVSSYRHTVFNGRRLPLGTRNSAGPPKPHSKFSTDTKKYRKFLKYFIDFSNWLSETNAMDLAVPLRPWNDPFGDHQ